MAICKPIKFFHRRICAGDLNIRIILKNRNLNAGTNTGILKPYTNDQEVWSSLKTVNGVDIFNSTGQVIGSYTHEWGVRYITNINTETIVEYNNKHFKILAIENLEERNEFLQIFTSLLGDKSIDINNI